MTSTYRQYQEARDTAWRALLRLEEKRLPVDPEALAAQLGVEIHPDPDPEENRRLWTLTRQVLSGRPVTVCSHFHSTAAPSQKWRDTWPEWASVAFTWKSAWGSAPRGVMTHMVLSSSSKL